MIRLSPTSLMTYLTCPEKYRISKIEKLVPITSSPRMNMGKAVHESLHTWYKNTSIEITERLNLSIDEGLKVLDNEEDGQLMIDLLSAYADKYPQETWKPIRGELHAEFFLSPEIAIHGFVDMVVYDGTHYIIVEHKTTSRDPMEFINSKNEDIQTLVYMYLAQKYTGQIVNRALFNVIQIMRRKGGAKFNFLRESIVKDQKDFDELECLIQEVSSNIERDITRKRFIKNRTQCYNLYECEYRKMCSFYYPGIESSFYKKDERRENV